MHVESDGIQRQLTCGISGEVFVIGRGGTSDAHGCGDEAENEQYVQDNFCLPPHLHVPENERRNERHGDIDSTRKTYEQFSKALLTFPGAHCPTSIHFLRCHEHFLRDAFRAGDIHPGRPNRNAANTITDSSYNCDNEIENECNVYNLLLPLFEGWK